MYFSSTLLILSVMIRFSTLLPISTPFLISAPPSHVSVTIKGPLFLISTSIPIRQYSHCIRTLIQVGARILFQLQCRQSMLRSSMVHFPSELSSHQSHIYKSTSLLRVSTVILMLAHNSFKQKIFLLFYSFRCL